MSGHNYIVFAVKDELTGRFLEPKYMETEPEAVRWFKYVLNNTAFWKSNAAMYSLYKLGIFNDVSGFEIIPSVELVQGGLSVLEEE